ncbi:hypothetical protein [Teredinibacter turnerae]|uniref:hypothetical protein n=1 Tax=Teredinibacter turnerae TaxID=2426 RepID=UPI0005A14DD3|nr:hypothetical protein [Teredinibacter turnerae]
MGRESASVGRALIKGISIATVATVVLPVILFLGLHLLTGSGDFLQAFQSASLRGGDLLSVLLVLNFVLVFLGLSVPEITRLSQRGSC